jgi:hypothetical protein
MPNEERPVEIVPDPHRSSPRVYSNYVQVSASPVDCTLTFCEVIGPQNEEEAREMRLKGVLPAPVKAVIAIPVEILDGFIQALEAQRRKNARGGASSSGTRVQ